MLKKVAYKVAVLCLVCSFAIQLQGVAGFGTHAPIPPEVAIKEIKEDQAQPVVSGPSTASRAGPVTSCNSTLGSTSNSLVIVAPSGSVCEWNNKTALRGVSGFSITSKGENLAYLTIEGGGTVRVNSSWALNGSGLITVEGGSQVVLGAGDHMLLWGRFAGLDVLTGSAVFLNGSAIQSVPQGGGSVFVQKGTLFGGRFNSTPPVIGATVGYANLTGNLSAVTVKDSMVNWLNVSGDIANITLSGSAASSPMTLSHIDALNSSIGNFFADNATVSNVTLGPVGNITLGNSTAKLSDLVKVDSLQVTANVPGSVNIAHAFVWHFQGSGAANVNVYNSTLYNGSGSLTDAGSSFTAISGVSFAYGLQFNSTRTVRLDNVTAPSLTFHGLTHATIDNWGTNTTIISGSVGDVPNISVLNQSAWVQIYRYVTVRVEGSGGSIPSTRTNFSIMDASIPFSSWSFYTLPASGILGLLLPTDNITIGGDAFTGAYEARAILGSVTVIQSFSLTGDGLTIPLQIVAPATSPIPIVYVYLAEVASLIAVVAATVYLSLDVRRAHRQKPRRKEENEPEPSP